MIFKQLNSILTYAIKSELPNFRDISLKLLLTDGDFIK